MPTDNTAVMAKELGLTSKRETVRVVVRVRPLSKKETQGG